MLRELLTIFRSGDPLASMGSEFTKMMALSHASPRAVAGPDGHHRITGLPLRIDWPQQEPDLLALVKAAHYARQLAWTINPGR